MKHKLGLGMSAGAVLVLVVAASALAATATILWVTNTGGPIHSTPVVDNGTVYLGTPRTDLLGSEANLYAYDAQTGAILWGTDIGGDVESSPALANGTLYIGSGQNGLYALSLDSDDDGVSDAFDVCPGTVADSIDPADLKNRHYAWYGGETLVSGGDHDPVFTIAETGGCSAEQIIDELGLGKGHVKFGLSLSALRSWIDQL
ncbi:MAG: PQQ-binding-like beta-propeller repeat protein [Polyangiales bacterium]|jgi:outer membrane protein assembly factor BamB